MTSAIVTEYRLHPVEITEDLPDAYLWDVVVQRVPRGGDRWIVRSPLFRWINSEGEWEGRGPREADDIKAWEDTHTFPLTKALQLAEHGQWTLKISGKTARDVTS